MKTKIIHFVNSYVLILIAIVTTNNFAQQPTYFPDAAWLQDVHWTGTVYAGISGPVIPNVQAHLEGVEYMFHLKSDVEKARPLIEKVNSEGKKYWVNLDAGTVEGDLDSILNDGQGITDPNFGAMESLEGNYFYLGNNVIRSINRPEWRNFIISCIKRAIDAGAEGSQHDGGGTVSYASFDDDEVSAFKIYIQENNIPTGDWNPDFMTFKEYLLFKGKTDSDVLNNDSDPQIIQDLMNHWKDFKAYNTLKSWTIIRDSCRAYAQSKGRDYTLALNAGSALGTREGNTYFASDYAIGEFFQWGNLFPYTGTLAAKVRMFHAINKRFILWSEPTLEDYPKNPYDPFPPDIEQGSYLHTIATLYASGGLPQLKYTALDTYSGYKLAQINREMLNSVVPSGKIGVVMSHAQTIKETRGLEGLISVLQDINRGFNVIFFKSNRLGLSDDLSLNDLSKYEVIFLPEVFYLTDNQRSVLLDYMWNGGTVIAVRGNVEYSGWVDENGYTQLNSTWSSLADDNNSGVKNYGSGKFINIAHNILEPSGYPPSLYGLAYIINKASTNQEELLIANSIRDTISYWFDYALPEKEVYSASMPNNLKVFQYQDTLTNHFVYHLISDSVKLPSREAIPVNPFNIELAVAPSGYLQNYTAKLYTIENPYGTEISTSLNVNQQTGRVSVDIPSFSRWAILELKETNQIGQIVVDSIKINGSNNPYRLKSGSDINLTWQSQNTLSNNFQIEIWTNLIEEGNPVVVDNKVLGKSLSNISSKSFLSGSKIFAKTVKSTNNSYTISGSEFRDSTVYFVRVRAVETNDTSDWGQQFFYRNARPGPPTNPALYTSHQSTWYMWSDQTSLAPPDTNYNVIFSFQKGIDNRGRYGGDFELDTLLYGIKIFTDSLDSKQGTDSSKLYYVGSQFNRKLGPFESYNGMDAIEDTLLISLEPYENYGIYIQPFATDFIDTSEGGEIFGFYLDNHNDPPNEFNLISPKNNSYTLTDLPFSWKNNGDPDPFNSTNHNISHVEIWFDSVSTFDSPGFKKYTKERTGNSFEQDTIVVNLPQNFFNNSGLINYKKIYWKAVMYDYDRDVAEGGGKGVLSRESSDTFVLNIGNTPNVPDVPKLVYPENNTIIDSLPVIFMWNAVQFADSYWLEISEDSLFTDAIIDSNITTNTKEVSELLENKNYFWRVRAKNISGWSDFSNIYKFSTVLTSIKEIEIPTKYSLEQNYPNPFNPTTTIQFSLPTSSNVNLSVYNLLGEKIIEILNGRLSAGVYNENIDLNTFSSGVYIYRITTDKFTALKKMILLK